MKTHLFPVWDGTNGDMFRLATDSPVGAHADPVVVLDLRDSPLARAGFNLLGPVILPLGLSAVESVDFAALMAMTRAQQRARKWETGEDLEARENRYWERCVRMTGHGMDLDTWDNLTLDAARAASWDAYEKLSAAEAAEGVVLRPCWSRGTEGGRVHLDWGGCEAGHGHPDLLRILCHRAKRIARLAGVPTSDDLNECLRSAWIAIQEAGLAVVGPPRRKGSTVKLKGWSRLKKAEFSMVQEILRRELPPVWVDLIPLRKKPNSRGGLYRPLEGLHKNGVSRKCLIDPAAHSPTNLTLEILAPDLEPAPMAEGCPESRKPTEGPSPSAEGADLSSERRQKLESWIDQTTSAYRLAERKHHRVDLSIGACLARVGLAEGVAAWAVESLASRVGAEDAGVALHAQGPE